MQDDRASVFWAARESDKDVMLLAGLRRQWYGPESKKHSAVERCGSRFCEAARSKFTLKSSRSHAHALSAQAPSSRAGA